MNVELVGWKEAKRALKSLPEHVKPEAQKVMDTTAFQVARAAEQRAPKATGLLRRSIGWKSLPRSLMAIVGAEKGTAFYWKFVEYGTVKAPARPFFRPAREAMEADHGSRLVQALERALSKMEKEGKQ